MSRAPAASAQAPLRLWAQEEEFCQLCGNYVGPYPGNQMMKAPPAARAAASAV